MERLTTEARKQFPLTTFNRCQLCGFESDDICEFRMWLECDDMDKPEAGNVLVVCKGCRSKISEHERLYHLVPWGLGEPGYLILLCGDCKFREDTQCKHPDLKKNGGKGLELFYADLPRFIVCRENSCTELGVPFNKCTGKIQKPSSRE